MKNALILTAGVIGCIILSGCTTNTSIVKAYASYQNTIGNYAVEKIKTDKSLTKEQRESMLKLDAAAREVVKEAQK